MNLMTQIVLHHGEYILDVQMDKGMFEITYQATHVQSGQKVVIKTLGETLRQHSEFKQFKQQFLELAARLKQCKHPHLIQVIDYFEDAGLPYLVKEFIEGQTLAQLIETNVVPEAKALEWIHQISAGLSVLHKNGLLHQNIKPENIIQRQNSASVVLCEDITSELREGITANPVPCTVYSSPEQYDCKTPRTRATDLYALSATLYYLLTGRPPLPATVRAVLHSGGNQESAAQEEYHIFSQNLQQRHAQISPAVKRTIWRGLELMAQRRPQTVEAWLALLASEKASTPQLPSLKQNHPVKLTSSSNKTSQAPIEEKLTPQSSLAQNLVKTFKIPPQEISPKLAKMRSPEPKLTPKKRSLLRALIVTGAIAASAGLGFGFALRLNSPGEPGSSLLHTEQSFPRTSNWPMSPPPL